MQENHRVRRGISLGRIAASTAGVALALSFVAPTARAERQGSLPPSYASVAPIFARWCVGCHGPREQHAELRLDSYAAILRGGDSGPSVAPGDPEASLLLAKVEHRDRPVMPPRRRLPAASAARLRAWIAAGARDTAPARSGAVPVIGRSRRRP